MRAIFRKMRETSERLRTGGLDADNSLQVGLLPTSGWRKRGLDYFGNRVFPTMLSPRGGQSFAPDYSSPVAEAIGVTWIGHATFVVQMGGKNILIDPNWAKWLGIIKRVREPGVSLVNLPPIDLVLVSHAHHDHLHMRSLNVIANGQPIIVPEGVGQIVRRCGFGEIIEMKYWEQRSIGDLLVTFTPAQHWGARYVHDTHRGFGGFIVTSSAGRSVYHCGDSAYFNGFQEIGRHSAIDLALLPIGAYSAPSGREVHMNPEEALSAFEELGAAHMCPMHYGTFALGREPMDEPVIRLQTDAEKRGVGERVRVLTEGQPEHF